MKRLTDLLKEKSLEPSPKTDAGREEPLIMELYLDGSGTLTYRDIVFLEFDSETELENYLFLCKVSRDTRAILDK